MGMIPDLGDADERRALCLTALIFVGFGAVVAGFVYIPYVVAWACCGLLFVILAYGIYILVLAVIRSDREVSEAMAENARLDSAKVYNQDKDGLDV